jgi:hypothetical protein
LKLWTFSRPNRILSCWSHTWQKKKQKEETKLQNPEPTAKTFSMPCYTEKTEGLLHCQMLAPKLLRRSRQIGLDAEAVTPELLRLKFCCS